MYHKKLKNFHYLAARQDIVEDKYFIKWTDFKILLWIFNLELWFLNMFFLKLEFGLFGMKLLISQFVSCLLTSKGRVYIYKWLKDEMYFLVTLNLDSNKTLLNFGWKFKAKYVQYVAKSFPIFALVNYSFEEKCWRLISHFRWLNPKKTSSAIF